jgi:hypothetical protein
VREFNASARASIGDANLEFVAGGDGPVLGPDGEPIRLAKVTAVYDRATGVLTATDMDTGEVVTIKAQSGGKPSGDPIPAGKWDILERGGKSDSFRLDAVDAQRFNDVEDSSGRYGFRLHKPGLTIGCIAAEDLAGWSQLKSLILNTSTTYVPDVATYWSGPSRTALTDYGQLTVK